MSDSNALPDPGDARAAAIKRLSARRDFGMHVVTFVIVNAGLVVIWLATGSGYFWPGWVLGGWGIGVLLHAWDVFGRKPISEADIIKEMNRQDAGTRSPR